ncbi:MAG TPA: N4-gp56 family major capsid protein [Terriglobales bacterium]|nr:N4-gp56 family major capsid protein [Terriglobales bacterium]
MPFEWGWDATTGTFKNHEVSDKVREASVAMTKFMQFVDPEPGYGKKKGESVTIPRIKNVAEPTDATFGERDRVPIDQFSMSTTSITVKYFGRGIELTSMAELLTTFDLRDRIQRKLMQQMRLALDTAAAAPFKAAQIKFIPTSLASGTFDTDGTASTAATVNLSVSHLKVIRDYMMDTIHVPGWRGGDEFYCLASTKACRGVRNDPEWIEAQKYKGDGAYLAKGEIGKVENIHVVEVNHTNALANNKGTGGVLGEFVVFGDDAAAMAVVEDPELRVALPGNFGLQHAIAWVGLLNFGIVWDTANDGEARIIHGTSS